MHDLANTLGQKDWDLNGEATDNNQTPDRVLRRQMAKLSAGISPVASFNLINDWALHLATAPDKQLSLARQAQANWIAWLDFVAKGCPETSEARPIVPKEGDRRFNHPAWSNPPFAAFAQYFLLMEDFVDQATSDIPGLSPANDKAMTFLARQMLDAVAPSNFLATNPEVLARTRDETGQNLLRGFAAFADDCQAAATGKISQHSFVKGKDIAATPGKVVFRTHLMELIQYAPTTDQVHPEPVLVVPAWIMKYYILDLSPENSLVRYLTSQGFTVYMISWRNPGSEDAALGMADYLRQGPMAALDFIGAEKVHTAGYCLGGTLLSIAAAAMARDGDTRLASMTLLAAQTDFSEAGELMLFINESQVSVLEDVMDDQGYLEAAQMMGAFQMLRSNDLIWSQMVSSYLMGEEPAPMNDLMAWNADGTRMPARMHSQYLRKMFLNNDLATGRYHVDGHAVSLRDIRVPIFCVGTETDHIAPWTSVFKIHNVGHADICFVLTSGGHNAGIISEPGHRHRHFRIHTTRQVDKALSSDEWREIADLNDGSWWPSWTGWLAENSSKKISPPNIARSLADAPGHYIMMD